MDITKGVLEVIAPNEITELLVLDRGFREVTYGTSQITVELDPGIYQVQARLPGARSEQLVAVEPGQTVTVNDFELTFDSPTPLVGIPSTHEFLQTAAYGQSRTLHATLGEVPNSRLFLFSRSGNVRFPVPVPAFVVRGQGLEVRFPEFGVYDQGGGWLALSLALPAGTYFVEQDVPELGRRGQVLFVEKDWQTQVFAPWEEIPDFSKAVIHMRRASIGYLDFDPNDATQTALDARTEAALEGLARGRLVMTRNNLQEFLDAKFIDPIMGLIGAYAMLVTDSSEYYDRLRNVVVPNLQMLLPHSPDVALLAKLVGSLQGWQATFIEPPLFAIGTERLLELAANGDVECPANSQLAEIAIRLTTGSAWTRWDEGISIDDAREQLQNALLDRLPHGRFADLNESAARFARELGLPLSIVTQEMNASVDAE
jgi:hypothetical protein